MSFGKFFKYCSILFTGFLIIGISLANVYETTDIRLALGAGLILSFGNALLGYALLAWGIKRPQKAFLVSVFGGMFFRILLIFSLLFILIKTFHLHLIALLLSLILTYFAFLSLEIFQVYKNAEEIGK